MAFQTEIEKIAHLLRRFGLGASLGEIDYYRPMGLKGTIDALLNYDQIADPFPIDPEILEPKQKGLSPHSAQLYWYARLLCTTRPLEEKMTLFWHNHFATSAQKVENGEAMFAHVGVLRANALGRFEKILNAVSKDPAMLYWLDNQENVKGKPNENFAREVMELFTLGIGHYTEQDVQNAARAFTGWSYGVMRKGKLVSTKQLPRRDAVYAFLPDRHDGSVKSVLGSRGNFNGDDILGILVGNLQTSKYVVHKMWEWFVYPNPEPGLVTKLATDFRNSGLDVKRLVRIIMESPEFYSSRAERAILKNPIDFTIGVARQLGLGSGLVEQFQSVLPDQIKTLRAATLIPTTILRVTKAQGMELLYPPDVSGWATGSAWISTATMVERIKLSDSIFRGIQVDAKTNKNKGRNTTGAYPAFTLLGSDPTPEGAVRILVQTLDIKMPQGKLNQLIRAAREASQGTVTQKNAAFVATSVCRLIFGSPEFQFI